MRLINVYSLDFIEVGDPSSVGYAILSHTWVAGQEVSLQDWERWRGRRRGWKEIGERSGLTKILDACAKTKKYNLDLLWVDTNCIDKLSSAELSEAINSMFKWYSLSTICLTYLADVKRHGIIDGSRWFTRGWTLQELLAPRKIDFYSKGWDIIGSKASLSNDISKITGIEKKYLDGSADFHRASVASRMSWAALRQTSRPEDMAYSLLGIFDINMPLLYGEGEGAFIRLQEEILKTSTDQSIFAWQFVERVNWKTFKPHPSWVSVLAPFPICFIDSGSVEPVDVQRHADMDIWSMTNLGLVMRLPLLATTNSRRFFAVLQCADQEPTCLCIPIVKVKEELIRAGWPAAPLPLCRISKQPDPVSVYLPRHQRHGPREDIWEQPTFTQPPRFLVFITTSLVDFVVESWVTTPGVELDMDYGLLSIVEPTNFEGVFLTFEQPNDEQKRFNAVVFSEPQAMIEHNCVYCQPWRAHELEPAWDNVWKFPGRLSNSINLANMLGGLLTENMQLKPYELLAGFATRPNPTYDIEAVLNIRDRGNNSFPADIDGSNVSAYIDSYRGIVTARRGSGRKKTMSRIALIDSGVVVDGGKCNGYGGSAVHNSNDRRSNPASERHDWQANNQGPLPDSSLLNAEGINYCSVFIRAMDHFEGFNMT